MYMVTDILKKISKLLNVSVNTIQNFTIGMLLLMLISCHIGMPSITDLGKEIIGNTIEEGMDVMEDASEKLKKQYKEKFKPQETYLAPEKALPGEHLFFLSNNKFSPECCEHSTISSNSGCACITTEQEEFLNLRGNNRGKPTASDIFSSMNF